jgi:uncharacterized metal-binding protein
MPGARTHDTITVVTAAAMTPMVLITDLPEMNLLNASALVGSYLFSGLMFSPDLDVRSASYRRWGPVRWLWIPYRKLVPHRSWVSHSFIIGPILRVLYFITMLTIVAAAAILIVNLLTSIDSTGTLRAITQAVAGWVAANPDTFAYLMLGLILGGTAHTLADIVFTAVKRRF